MTSVTVQHGAMALPINMPVLWCITVASGGAWDFKCSYATGAYKFVDLYSYSYKKSTIPISHKVSEGTK